MSDKAYYADRIDADRIHLRGQLSMGGAVIRRDQVASVYRTLGKIVIETTGGAQYVVLPGIRRKQKDITNQVFADYGITV